MKSAWLILQELRDRNGNPVLDVCTKDSVANALLDMAVQGLNPMKKQGYFIAYGSQLTFQRSYMGTMAVAMQVNDAIAEIVAEVVYDGDEFEFEIVRGKKQIVKHKQTLDSITSKKIKAAYCVVYDHEGNAMRTDIMTYDEIKQAWKQSRATPFDEQGNLKTGSTHAKFTAEMAKKTVINRTCKPIINASSDRQLLASIRRTEDMEVESTVQEDIETHANRTIIDLDPIEDFDETPTWTEDELEEQELDEPRGLPEDAPVETTKPAKRTNSPAPNAGAPF